MRSDKDSTSWSTSDNRISLLVLKEKVSILWKKSSNSDGQEVHKYQQNNHLSTQIIEHKKDQEVHVLVWDIHNNNVWSTCNILPYISEQRKIPTLCSSVVVGLWCLTSLSTIFRGGQCYWWRKPEYPKKTTDLPQVINTIFIT